MSFSRESWVLNPWGGGVGGSGEAENILNFILATKTCFNHNHGSNQNNTENNNNNNNNNHNHNHNHNHNNNNNNNK